MCNNLWNTFEMLFNLKLYQIVFQSKVERIDSYLNKMD